MKKLSLIILSVFIVTFVACDPAEDGDVNVTSVSVYPATFSMFANEELPSLEAIVAPTNATNPTVSWSSDNTDVISVDEATGELTNNLTEDFEEPVVVTITATAGGVTGTCVITVKGEISRYNIIDCSSEVGLLILDRNVGATAAYDMNLTGEAAEANLLASAGDYYQWGRNTPADAPGSTEAGPNHISDWSAASEGFVNWAEGGKTPCPKGWGLITDDQYKKLGAVLDDIALWDYGMIDDADDALALWDKMLLPPTGMVSARTGTLGPHYRAGYVCLWMARVHTGVNMYSAYIYVNFPIASGVYPDFAGPLRCVKDAE